MANQDDSMGLTPRNSNPVAPPPAYKFNCDDAKPWDWLQNINTIPIDRHEIQETTRELIRRQERQRLIRKAEAQAIATLLEGIQSRCEHKKALKNSACEWCGHKTFVCKHDPSYLCDMCNTYC